MDWIAILNGVIGAGGLAIILRLIDAYINRGKVRAEAVVLKSEATENINEAAQVAVNILQQALAFKALENKEYRERVETLERNQRENSKLIKELQDHRDERGKQIEELQEKNEALLSQVAGLRAQIAKDTAETRELRNKYQELKQFTQSLIDALEKRGISLPELNGKIPDSISGWKHPK